MSTIHLPETTTATPEPFVAGLTDFGPGRSKLFPNSADEYLKVHDQGPGHADVTEGSGGIWERLQYDWSDPNRVVMKTTDSNIWGGSSGHTYALRGSRTGRPLWMPSWCARARTSRDGCSGWCSEPSARANWKGLYDKPSRLSRPGTKGRRRRTPASREEYSMSTRTSVADCPSAWIELGMQVGCTR